MLTFTKAASLTVEGHEGLIELDFGIRDNDDWAMLQGALNRGVKKGKIYGYHVRWDR